MIVHDELDLPVGALKVKAGGGLAGHNGLRSIKAHLHTDAFLRVRIGVGKPASKEQGADHVLKRFSKRERTEIDVVHRGGGRRRRVHRRRRRRRRHEPLQLTAPITADRPTRRVRPSAPGVRSSRASSTLVTVRTCPSPPSPRSSPTSRRCAR